MSISIIWRLRTLKGEDVWLNKKSTEDELFALCKPYPDHLMNRHRVSKKANAVSTSKKPNKGMDLIEPVEDELRQNSLFQLNTPKPKAREAKSKTWNSDGRRRLKSHSPQNQTRGICFRKLDSILEFYFPFSLVDLIAKL